MNYQFEGFTTEFAFFNDREATAEKLKHIKQAINRIQQRRGENSELDCVLCEVTKGGLYMTVTDVFTVIKIRFDSSVGTGIAADIDDDKVVEAFVLKGDALLLVEAFVRINDGKNVSITGSPKLPYFRVIGGTAPPLRVRVESDGSFPKWFRPTNVKDDQPDLVRFTSRRSFLQPDVIDKAAHTAPGLERALVFGTASEGDQNVISVAADRSGVKSHVINFFTDGIVNEGRFVVAWSHFGIGVRCFLPDEPIELLTLSNGKTAVYLSSESDDTVVAIMPMFTDPVVINLPAA